MGHDPRRTIGDHYGPAFTMCSSYTEVKMEYRPAGKLDNALQQVAFLIELNEAFSQKELQDIHSKRSLWVESLPRISVNRGFVFQSARPNLELDDQTIVGLSYEYLKADGSIQSGLRIDGNRILYIIGEYSRWETIWPDVSSILNNIIEAVPEKKIVAYSSEYTDSFLAVGSYFDFDATCILNKGSELISSHVFNRKLNWHSHTGFFEEISEPARHRTLTRINIDLKDKIDEQERELSIVLLLSMSGYMEPFATSSSVPKEVLERGLDENFFLLHQRARDLMKDLLVEDMQRRISLL